MVEHGGDVVGPGAGLRMTLKAERGPIAAVDTLQGPVEQGTVCSNERLWQRLLVHCKSMVLTADHYVTPYKVLYGMVSTMVAEFHLHRPRSTGQTQELMSQADTENR